MTDTFAEWDAHIHAFVALSDKPAKAGPLGGLSMGVKDIIDVAGVPTRNGSAACADALPAEKDALVVQNLRAAGARIAGKTTTTEFAFTDPTPCRNPHDLNRSPGGSSSGSGAAVAAGIVDLALGTQTAGSLIRPAAYCGVVGFKPTTGALPLHGVTPLAPSFDTVGIIARDVELIRQAFEVLNPAAQRWTPDNIQATCGLWEADVLVRPDWVQALQDAQGPLGRLTPQVTSYNLPADVDRIVGAHRVIMCAEAFANHSDLLGPDTAHLLKPKFRAGLQAGRDVSATAFDGARRVLADARAAFWGEMKEAHLFLTLPVPDGAPLMDGTTGFQDWLTPWTVFGGPLICLPWGRDSLMRPRSVMLAAHPGQDLFLLSIAAQLERAAPEKPIPQLPR